MSPSHTKPPGLIEALKSSAPFLLLGLTIFTVFIIPVFPVQMHDISYNLAYSAIFFVSVSALDSKRKLVLVAAVIAFVTEWLATIFDASILLLLSRLSNLLFFSFVVVRLIIQIAGYKRVNLVMISEAVSGYLLLGLMFSIFVLLSIKAQPGAFNFDEVGAYGMSDVVYYTFVTLTTLGYGDLLPVLPAAKSIAMLIAVTGQLYLAIIVATLVGKFLNQASS